MSLTTDTLGELAKALMAELVQDLDSLGVRGHLAPPRARDYPPGWYDPDYEPPELPPGHFSPGEWYDDREDAESRIEEMGWDSFAQVVEDPAGGWQIYFEDDSV